MTMRIEPETPPRSLEELSGAVLRFVHDLEDVIDAMLGRSAGVLDRTLLAELAKILEDQSWAAVAAYERCCVLVAEVDVPVPLAWARAGSRAG